MALDIDDSNVTGTIITDVANSDKSDSPPDWVTCNHVDYEANIVDWTLFGDAVTGKGGFKDGTYLIEHKREDPARYTKRKETPSYINHTAPIIDTYTGHIYKKEVVRKSDDPAVEAFWESTNRKGEKSIELLAKEISRASSTFGHCFVIVDKKIGDNVETQEDEANQDIRPYAYVVNPTQLINWGLDEDGNFAWINIKETFITDEDDPAAEHALMVRYRIWTKDEWLVFEEGKSSVVARGTHALGEVPVVMVSNIHMTDGSAVGRSDIQDIAKLNRDIFNWQSELKILLGDTVFNILIMPADGLEKDSDTGDYKELNLGTDRVLLYGEGGEPKFIAPSQDSVESYETRILNTVEDIYKMARLDYRGGVTPSGVAMQFKFEKTNQILADKAANLENGEKRIARLVKMFASTTGDANMDDTTIQYPQEFGLQDMERELKMHGDVLDLGLGEMFGKEYKKNVAIQLLPNANEKIITEIHEEIDSEEMVDPDLVPEGENDE